MTPSVVNATFSGPGSAPKLTSILCSDQVSRCGDLPDDVLCAIFSACGDLDPPYRSYSRGAIVHHLGWIALGHVTRRWRTLLLGLAPLWAGIACVFPTAVHEIVARSRGAPLTFNVPYLNNEGVEEELVRLALSKITQIRCLRIGSRRSPIECKYPQDVTHALTKKPLPLLEEVALYIRPYFAQTGTPGILPTPRATGQLDTSLTLYAPALRAYSHCNLFVLACPTLTSLETTETVDIESSPRHIVEMLRGFPLLATICLHLKCGPDFWRNGAPVPVSADKTSVWFSCMGQPVVLEYLRSASFFTDSQDADIIGLWSCIQAPANCDVLLSGFDLAVAIDPARRALERQLQNPSLDTLLVKCTGNSDVEVVLRSSRLIRRASGGHHVTLATESCDTDSSQMPAIISSLVSALQTPAIRHLNLLNVVNHEDYDSYNNDEMRRALEPLSSVNVMSVHGDSGVAGIIRMLDVQEGGPSPLFPELDTLVVHLRIKWYEPEDWHVDCWRAVAEVLEHRKHAGVPVREMRVTGGWLSEGVHQYCTDTEAPYLAKAQAAVKVVRDRRIVRHYEQGCECCDTDLERQSEDEDEETV